MDPVHVHPEYACGYELKHNTEVYYFQLSEVEGIDWRGKKDVEEGGGNGWGLGNVDFGFRVLIMVAFGLL